MRFLLVWRGGEQRVESGVVDGQFARRNLSYGCVRVVVYECNAISPLCLCRSLCDSSDNNNSDQRLSQ